MESQEEIFFSFFKEQNMVHPDVVEPKFLEKKSTGKTGGREKKNITEVRLR